MDYLVLFFLNNLLDFFFLKSFKIPVLAVFSYLVKWKSLSQVWLFVT